MRTICICAKFHRNRSSN